VSLAEIETKTERPGSLLQRFAKAEEIANLVLYYSSPLLGGIALPKNSRNELAPLVPRPDGTKVDAI